MKQTLVIICMLLLSFVPIWCVRECVDMDDDHKFERVEMRRVRIVAAGDLMLENMILHQLSLWWQTALRMPIYQS